MPELEDDYGVCVCVCVCVCNLQQMTSWGMRGSDGGKCFLGWSHISSQRMCMDISIQLKFTMHSSYR